MICVLFALLAKFLQLQSLFDRFLVFSRKVIGSFAHRTVKLYHVVL